MVGRRTQEVMLTELDARLLLALEEEGNLVHACRKVGIGRDRGNSRLLRLASAIGGPIVEGQRGGGAGRGTLLTPAGRRLLRQARQSTRVAPESTEGPLEATILHGIFSSKPQPRVRLPGGTWLHVAFRRPEGSTVAVAIDPEVVLVARRRLPTSARNALDGTVRSLHPESEGRELLHVDVGGAIVGAGVTPESVSRLRLRPGARVVLYIKALSVRAIG